MSQIADKAERMRNLPLVLQILEQAWRSSVNGRGSWWNAGASHMKQAFPNVYFQRLGLVSILVYGFYGELHARAWKRLTASAIGYRTLVQMEAAFNAA